VLAGLLIPVDDPLSKYFGGLLGLFVGFNTIAGVILSVCPESLYFFLLANANVLLKVWHPGGVRHAARIDVSTGKERLAKSDMNIARRRVDLVVKDLGLSWFRAGFGPIKNQQKTILQEINFRAPAGQITAILVGPFFSFSAQLTLY
jgi:hypothetical protein